MEVVPLSGKSAVSGEFYALGGHREDTGGVCIGPAVLQSLQAQGLT